MHQQKRFHKCLCPFPSLRNKMLGGGQRVPLLPSVLSFTARWMSVPLFERSQHLCYASDDLKRLPASVCRSLRGLPATHGCTESLQLAGSLPSSFLCLAPQPCSTALPMGLVFALFFELHQQALPGTEVCTVFCCYGLRAAGILGEVPTGPRGHAQKGLGS